MRIFALQLNNDIRGLGAREEYIESLIAKLDKPDIIVLPELSQPGYIGNTELWQYADQDGKRTSDWAVRMAQKYGTAICAGYLEAQDGDFFNAYLIADGTRVYGKVYKSEGESFLVKRGDFPNIIATPFGNVTVAICYDSRRKHIYDNIHDKTISLILFPHGSPTDPKKQHEEKATIDHFCGAYAEAFKVPVVYCNSVGAMGNIMGKTGAMMQKAGFALCGNTKIYGTAGQIATSIPEAVGADADLVPRSRVGDIRFYGQDLVKGNALFRLLVLMPDIKAGMRYYEENKHKFL